MNKIVLKIIAVSLVALAILTSCDSNQSLQQFYVDSSEKEGYITTSIPKTIVGIDDSKLSADAQKAYQSIEKINVLALPYDAGNVSQLETETAQLESILGNEKYELLMSHNSEGVKVKVLFDGSQDAIDEIIVYGSSPKMGLGVARILGDDMNMGAIMAMMQEMNSSDIDVNGVMGMMKNMGLDVGAPAAASE